MKLPFMGKARQYREEAAKWEKLYLKQSYDLARQKDLASQRLAKLSELENEVYDLRIDLTIRNREIEDLRFILGEFETNAENASLDMEAEIDRLNYELDMAHAEIDDLRGQNEILEDEPLRAHDVIDEIGERTMSDDKKKRDELEKLLDEWVKDIRDGK